MVRQGVVVVMAALGTFYHKPLDSSSQRHCMLHLLKVAGGEGQQTKLDNGALRHPQTMRTHVLERTLYVQI